MVACKEQANIDGLFECLGVLLEQDCFVYPSIFILLFSTGSGNNTVSKTAYQRQR